MQQIDKQLNNMKYQTLIHQHMTGLNITLEIDLEHIERENEIV